MYLQLIEDQSEGAPTPAARKDGSPAIQSEMLMGMTFVIVGVLLLLSVGVNLATGRIRVRNGIVLKSVSPVAFWCILAMKCAVLVFVMFPQQCLSLVQFGIEDTSAGTARKVREFQQGKSSELETDEQSAVDNPGRQD